jgi:AcrR family transcriptional regulator
MQTTQLRQGRDTREKILALAESAVLEKGFAATSIDELIAAAGITKGGFFYHFRDKADLAKALMQRYIAHNDDVLLGFFQQADRECSDPRAALLRSLELFAQAMANIPGTHPGCLVASYCYQDQLFNAEVRALTRTGVTGWRKLFRERLAAVAATYPLRRPVDLDDLADMANALVDGGIILSKLFQDREALPRQIRLYREFIACVFADAPG